MFLQVCVILFTGGVTASVHAGIPPPPLKEQTPLQEQTPSQSRHPPEADSGIRSTSGRYASYWNAFLLT